MSSGINFVLFDLDGTLFNSAPDLVAAANRLLVRRSRPPIPFEQLRSHAGRGARGLIGATLGIPTDHPDYPSIQKEFLDDYQTHCCERSEPFEGVEHLLSTLEEHHMPWGIVTNKHARFTLPIAQACGWTDRARCIVCGDATNRLKPAPDNLLLALEQTGYVASETLYVGDDYRDAQAARAAGMRFAAAAYGYLGLVADVSTWQADFVLSTPESLIDVVADRP